MRIVAQRVTEAKVTVAGKVVGEIGHGLAVFVGVGKDDTPADADYLVSKLLSLRIFMDPGHKMNLSVVDVGGAVLVVSQFTLYADILKGRRPAFDQAASPEAARILYEYFVQATREGGVRVQTGVFQAAMEVALINAGPVTIMADSADKLRPLNRAKENSQIPT